ncbi:MAG: Holliday junction branch migration protein RuvA [Kiritimatiellae bacterium]|nr:Holliday junction branch migration protein RuvA [Kiritimatiellia bacterium]
MIASLHGTILEKTPGYVVIECGGVGYEASIPLGTYNDLPSVGSECRLFVRHVVRQDDEQLFGFSSKDDRAIFDMLLAVNGVGPKLAICVLGGMTSQDFKRCVADGDAKRLGSVKGIGKKTAERIIVELRGRINPLEALSTPSKDGKNDAALHDTILALSQLGFAQDVAAKMVQAALDAGADASRPDDLLRHALAAR